MATAKAYGLSQEFITPYTPEQNVLVERFIRTLKKNAFGSTGLGAQRKQVGDIKLDNVLQLGEATSGFEVSGSI